MAAQRRTTKEKDQIMKRMAPFLGLKEVSPNRYKLSKSNVVIDATRSPDKIYTSEELREMIRSPPPHKTKRVKLGGAECEVDAKIARTVELLNNVFDLNTWDSCEGRAGERASIGFTNAESSNESALHRKLSRAFGTKPKAVKLPEEERHPTWQDRTVYQFGLVRLDPEMKTPLEGGKFLYTPKQLTFRRKDIPKIEKVLETGKQW